MRPYFRQLTNYNVLSLRLIWTPESLALTYGILNQGEVLSFDLLTVIAKTVAETFTYLQRFALLLHAAFLSPC